MRKAFDANVPKLKPRLRPAMSVVQGVVKENRNEETTIVIENTISRTDINPDDSVLNPDSVTMVDQKSPENKLFTHATDDVVIAETDTDTQNAVQCAASGSNEHTNRNNPTIFNASLIDSDSAESKELPDQNNVKKQVSTFAMEAYDENGIENTQNDTAGKLVQSTDTLNSAAIGTLSDIQSVVLDPIPTISVVPAPVIDDVDARRKRLENVKRKVSDAVRPEVRIEPVPEDPALAVESVLGLVNDLEAQLLRSREVENALRNELAEAKADLTRTVDEGRTASGRLMQVEAQLDEKRTILEEMLFEMGALEEERDQAVRMVQMLTAKEKERQVELDTMRHQLAEMQRTLDESHVEEERLSGELDEYCKENTRMHILLAEITKERDILVYNEELLTKERDDLIKAKMALEKVHNALSQARARLQN